jgi:simple sugar transport system permease protein
LSELLDPVIIMFVAFFLGSMLRSATPVLFTALGETYGESAGVLNIGAEGMMLTAAFTAFVAAAAANSLLVGVLVGVGTGIAFGLIFAVLVVTLRADQIVIGVGFDIAAVGLTSLGLRVIYGTAQLPVLPSREVIDIAPLSSIPIIGKAFFSQDAMVYLAIVLVPVFYYVLYRTRFGLKLRTLGENPMVADTAGVNVFFMRYIVLMLVGAMAGLAGTYLSIYQVGFFRDDMTQGRGFIAIAVTMFARWNPVGVFLASLLYGGAESMAGGLQALGFLRTIPTEVVLMLPYIVTIVGLVALARRARLPPALAKPYRREL